MEIKFNNILERDIDLLVINNLYQNKSFVDFFLNQINENSYNVTSIEHSLMDPLLGESDITVILENSNERIALLIEDKINADAMPNQYLRYIDRGNKGIENKQYNRFFIFIIAPEEYLKTNIEAEKYDYKISYEEILKELNSDLFASSLLKKAIEEKESGYIAIENENVTNFWLNLYSFIKEYYPSIMFNEVNTPRGSNATWPIFLTHHKFVKIHFKSDRGFLDLSFRNFKKHIKIFNKYVDKERLKNYDIVLTNKSISIRKEIPIIDFNKKFYNYNDEMHLIMKEILSFYDLLKEINVLAMYDELKEANHEISSVADLKKMFPKAIIVNYDKRIVHRCSTNNNEQIGGGVNYPYIQRYQTGAKPNSLLFIIIESELYQLERQEKENENSSYIIKELTYSINESFFSDDIFLKVDSKPVNVKGEVLLEIVENIK